PKTSSGVRDAEGQERDAAEAQGAAGRPAAGGPPVEGLREVPGPRPARAVPPDQDRRRRGREAPLRDRGGGARGVARGGSAWRGRGGRTLHGGVRRDVREGDAEPRPGRVTGQPERAAPARVDSLPPWSEPGLFASLPAP